MTVVDLNRVDLLNGLAAVQRSKRRNVDGESPRQLTGRIRVRRVFSDRRREGAEPALDNEACWGTAHYGHRNTGDRRGVRVGQIQIGKGKRAMCRKRARR